MKLFRNKGTGSPSEILPMRVDLKKKGRLRGFLFGNC